MKSEISGSFAGEAGRNFALSETLLFRSLPGLTPFAEAEALQRELVERRIRNEIPDTVLFLEHTPVITRGRGLQRGGVAPSRAIMSPVGTEAGRQLPLGALPPGTDYAECSRGGDLTWHGPGQLVIYPIFKIEDLGFYLRDLERVAISVIEAIAPGLRAFSRENAAGVWVEPLSASITPRGQGAAWIESQRPKSASVEAAFEKTAPLKISPLDITPLKIASLGVAVRKWVTYHGLSLNCVNDRTGFDLISPCGYAPEVMTRLADHASLGADWRSRIEAQWILSHRSIATDRSMALRS